MAVCLLAFRRLVMPSPKDDVEPVIDLESSSQVELDRVPGCDSDAPSIDQSAGINEPHHRRVGTADRELLKNEFSDEP